MLIVNRCPDIVLGVTAGVTPHPLTYTLDFYEAKGASNVYEALRSLFLSACFVRTPVPLQSNQRQALDLVAMHWDHGAGCKRSSQVSPTTLGSQGLCFAVVSGCAHPGGVS